MDVVHDWTGRTACALQAALRLSNESFSRKLDVAVRTVAGWHEKPDLVPRPETQQLLDIVLEQAPDSTRARFFQLIDTKNLTPLSQPAEARSAHALKVAIAVVVNGSTVLIVQRRGEDMRGISWQFPAGVVKPGVAPEMTAVRETFAETGVHCSVIRSLGSRLHPVTKVYCDYLLCEYLAGEALNMDVVENVSVTWAATDRLTRFIPVERIFPPILEALEVPHE
ncbi:NUDIX hydrolase [Kutzneria albida]|nr:NUDIX domain-containing protein [Kutzneria albida]